MNRRQTPFEPGLTTRSTSNSRPSTLHRLVPGIAIALGLLAATPAWANTVDDFSATQGPITVGPGEEPLESEATGFFDGVLDRFRVMAPALDDEAAAGSTATAEIGGGEFTCIIDFANNNSENGGGCTVAWAPDDETDDGVNETFDVTNAGAFEFEVLEAAPGTVIGMFMTDNSVAPEDLIGGQANGVFFFIENPIPGTYTLPIDQFFLPSGPLFDFNEAAVTNIGLVVGYIDGAEGTTRIGPVTSLGPIVGGTEGNPPDGPDDPPPDEELINFVSGTYFNPARDGEGCQVTLEGDGVTIILTCYLFQDGAQAWIIGAGTLSNGQVVFNMTLTSGADFGNDFDADDVVRTPWGTAIMRWSDCNTAEIELNSNLPDYPPITLVTTKVTRNNCDGPGPDAALLASQGTLFDPLRDGEGFQLALQGETGIFVLTWYTYLNGEQVWLIGTGTQNGAQLVFDDLVITSGADFGADFDPNDVDRTFWGQVIFQFLDCNNAIAFVTPMNGQEAMFDQFEIQVRKLVTGVCS
ncbi:MAG: hypothetical protein V2I57_08215 [Xanthomonadales bacterium]|jgi:hypothetical protein|nr:hypothetical protein [Xanthomonadales bacterium]